MLENWAQEYGPVFRVPIALGRNQLVLCDPKAMAHIYSKETYGYVQSGFARIFIESLVSAYSFVP